jgi:hypothetical protein
MHIGHPFRVDGRGRIEAVDDENYLRQLIEQVLFTVPGERVNRPDFGTGLNGLVFEPDGEELHTAVEYLVQGGLQRWLGDLVQVQGVEVSSGTSGLDGELDVLVQYVTLSGRRSIVVSLPASAGGPA